MNTLPNYNLKRWLARLVVAVAALLLAACTSVTPAFTPEQAVAQVVLHSPRQDVVVDVASVKALQRLDVAGKTFVVVANNQQAGDHLETCLGLYEARRSPLIGWVSGSGGGGCSGQIAGNPEPPQPMEVGGGSQSSGDPSEPDICTTYGKVNQPDIVTVRVTWNDGQVQEVPVVNGSYAAIRVGQFSMTHVDGLNEKGEPVFQFDQATGPVKQ